MRPAACHEDVRIAFSCCACVDAPDYDRTIMVLACGTMVLLDRTSLLLSLARERRNHDGNRLEESQSALGAGVMRHRTIAEGSYRWVGLHGC